ncbi:unnamed protein product [Colletotrichum noveboracense]|uniref:Uncharacterized protein n=2 Tax=Colletotrichum gloeosporioides species complex TaxID=2707338 RepID=A0A9W4S820_9PEZI|nr:uncharacterized protein CGMCC3_g10942 [Colletotrichum fructicola]KAE9573158.1 hypothetical protein CGMCC3_g10942 [Colletotrichum fructicola]KAF4483121.1 hypothetical protein CGGC5_v008995 [Colletotrichum fructicola Nara gc5]KAF5509428.1 hypothetical protein CGCF413_v002920 [Colletotrichum fructicola]CAI0655014.1 unnamed protein product [Colletotrichum noveboracense]
MLTVKQPTHYGYKSVHDLPTPPSTSRPSPPLSYQDHPSHKLLPSIPRSHSPPGQPMSTHHRGLPPPAAMTLPPQPPHSTAAPPPPPPPAPQPISQPPSTHSHAMGQLPGPPPQWQGAEDSMRSWLAAKTEEERRRQEEEKTRQESLRLEQRRIEADMLRTSLSGGIPPPIVPLVFAGMGGGVLPPAAMEWAQQFLNPHGQPQHHQLLPSQGPLSPDHRRDSQSQPYGQYPGVPSTPSSAPGPHGFTAYPGSPGTRGRATTLSSTGSISRPLGSSNLPSLNTNVPQSGSHGSSTMQSHQAHSTAQSAAAQQEAQPSPSIYFHHWHPPTSQAGGGSTQPATPSGESPRNKRKATGPQPAAPPPSQQRLRSPPFHGGSTLGNPPPGRRRGHSRQRSDLSFYRPGGRGRGESFGTPRGMSPQVVGSGSGPDQGSTDSTSSQQQQPARTIGGHSVSSLLSEDP